VTGALFDPDLFEPLTEARWDEARVRDAVAAIVADADRRCRPKLLWPAEEWDAWQSPRPLKTLYTGAAGVAWALDALRRRGLAETRLDLPHVVARALEAWRARPGVLLTIEQPTPAESSLFHGESGILTVLWLLEPDTTIADDLHACAAANVDNEANEVFWGAPGTMLVSQLMLDRTSDSRWADVWTRSADELWRRRGDDGLWTQRLHGGEARSLGVPHGLVGNTLALLHGDLGEERRGTLVPGTIAALEKAAVWSDGYVTWPTRAGGALRTADGELRLQWCGGAPGVVLGAADYLPDELLLPAARLTWHAGPHRLDKGPGICHGTAGNGYALLKAFERTQDVMWLDRAHRFAVHALEQVERLRARRGRGRYSLWTGDIGVAIYAADCLAGKATYPIFETWD
jgi:hypothetical protein